MKTVHTIQFYCYLNNDNVTSNIYPIYAFERPALREAISFSTRIRCAAKQDTQNRDGYFPVVASLQYPRAP